MSGLRARVTLAISAFRSDESILRLVRELCPRGEHPFHSIVVVDSLPSGRLEEALASGAFPRMVYRSFATNLGSAGNLMERLRAAAESGADYVYAINHDAVLDVDVVRALVAFASARSDLGAIYPTRRYVQRGGAIDMAGARADVLGTLLGGRRSIGEGPVQVHWSSSNGALYALDPVRRGLLPWGDLFMGYEDLEYGWALERAGYAQFMLGGVHLDDTYEYRRYRFGPLAFYASDKPAWYTYYQARNLILIAHRHDRGGLGAFARIAVELGLVGAIRNEKTKRLGYLLRGSFDGLRGTRGKWRLP